jgi:hypothetical protein
MTRLMKHVLVTAVLIPSLSHSVASQTAPHKIGVSSLRYGIVSIDLPADQQLVVLGVSVYGDVRLLFPVAGKSKVAPAGKSQLSLDFGGPWLQGGEKRPAPPSRTNECMVDRSPAAGRTAMTSPNPTTPYCGGSSVSVPVPLVTPMLSHLILLGTDPFAGNLGLDLALTGFLPEGRTSAIAAELGARLRSASGDRPWWTVGKSVALRTAN